MELKDASELGRYQNCPPRDLSACSCRTAFRFVHAELKDDRNYLPSASEAKSVDWNGRFTMIGALS